MSVVILCLSINAHSTEVLDISNIKDKIDLLSHLEYHTIAENDDIYAQTQLADERWLAPQGVKGNLGHSDNPAWFRITLTGLDKLKEQTYIRLNYPHHDYIDVYYLQQDNVIKHFQGGDQRIFSERPIDLRIYLFPITATAVNPASIDVYIRIATPGPLMMPLDIVTYPKAADDERSMYLWGGAYFGIMAIMLIYNTFIWVATRDFTYFLYLVYLTAAGALQFALFGFGFKYLWPDNPGFNNEVIIFLTPFMQLTAVIFVLKFVDIENTGTKLDKAIGITLFILVTLLTIVSLSLPYATVLTLGHIIGLSAVTAGIYIGIKGWVRGLKAARIFTIAWLANLIFIAWYLFDITGMVNATVIGGQGIAIGSIVELALLSIAFADKINQEKELRISTQQELLEVQLDTNIKLDNKVRERTQELEAVNEQLARLSITDPLTSLYNRRHFDKVYIDNYYEAFRYKKSIAILMIDIDHFKRLNDLNGHAFGDLCLIKAAQLIRGNIHRPTDLVARYGGEEFIVMLPDTVITDALNIAESIRKAFVSTIVSEGRHSEAMTVSIGVHAEIPIDRENWEKLLKDADDLLYQAKNNGRNQVSIAS